jgi:hypothetical protein
MVGAVGKSLKVTSPSIGMSLSGRDVGALTTGDRVVAAGGFGPFPGGLGGGLGPGLGGPGRGGAFTAGESGVFGLGLGGAGTFGRGDGGLGRGF